MTFELIPENVPKNIPKKKRKKKLGAQPRSWIISLISMSPIFIVNFFFPKWDLTIPFMMIILFRLEFIENLIRRLK